MDRGFSVVALIISLLTFGSVWKVELVVTEDIEKWDCLLIEVILRRNLESVGLLNLINIKMCPS